MINKKEFFKAELESLADEVTAICLAADISGIIHFNIEEKEEKPEYITYRLMNRKKSTPSVLNKVVSSLVKDAKSLYYDSCKVWHNKEKQEVLGLGATCEKEVLEGLNKEEIYDTFLSPIIQEIVQRCYSAGVGILLHFYIEHEKDRDLQVTTRLTDHTGETPINIHEATGVLLHGSTRKSLDPRDGIIIDSSEFKDMMNFN